MIKAYNEIYLSRMRSTIADAFVYAIEDCNINPNSFLDMISASRIIKRIENGELSIIQGISGVELAMEIINDTTVKENDIVPLSHYDRSENYWIGYAYAHYQWYTSRTFENIFAAIPYDEMLRLYHTLHEVDISKFVDIAEERIHKFYKDTALKTYRLRLGYSQSELSKLSGVSLRSIQMYKQRNKDINKAAGETLFKLSRQLNCSIESLLEK